MAKFTDPKIQEYLLNGGKIKRKSYDFTIFLNGNNGSLCFLCGCAYCLNKEDLAADDWEVVKQEYDWNRIIKDKILCVFWEELEETDTPIVGYLTKKTAEGFRAKWWYCFWEHCKPFNPADFNIIENIKDYKL